MAVMLKPHITLSARQLIYFGDLPVCLISSDLLSLKFWHILCLQAAVSAGRVLKIEEGARSGGLSDEEQIVRIRGWLLAYLSPEEQDALCRLWMFKGGFEFEAAQAMLGSSTPRGVQATLCGLRDTSCLQLNLPPATGSSSARYSMHALVGDMFRDEFDALPEPLQSSILQHFSGLMASKVDTLGVLQDEGRWLDAANMMADELLNFQELRFMLQSNGPLSDALSADGLRKLIDLGGAMGSLGQYAEAATLLHEVTHLANRSLGPRHVDTLISMARLASALLSMGEYAAAIAQSQQVLHLRRESLGDDHPHTVQSMRLLARALEVGGDLTAAVKQHAEALQATQRLHGKEHRNTLISMTDMASCLGSMGWYSRAVRMHKEALELAQNLLGPQHPDTIGCMQNVAVHMNAMGEHAKAAQQLEQVVQLQRHVMGEKHPHTLMSMLSWGSALLDLDENAKVAVLLEEALLLHQEVLGNRYPETLATMHAIACTLAKTGRHAEAARQHMLTLRLRQEVLGLEHQDTARSMHDLGQALYDNGQHTAAAQWLEQAFQIRKKVLGARHWETFGSMLTLCATGSRRALRCCMLLCVNAAAEAVGAWIRAGRQFARRAPGRKEGRKITSVPAA